MLPANSTTPTTRYLWPVVCLLLEIISAGPVSAIDFTLASRQMVNHSRYADAYSQSGMTAENDSLLQTCDRLSFREESNGCIFKAEYEFTVRHQTAPRQHASKSWATTGFTAGYKKFRCGTELLAAPFTNVSGELERFEFAFSAGGFDIQLGRQPVSFGTSHFISVIDVLSPFQPGYVDGSFKPGIDALRVRSIAGTTGEAELIIAAAPDNAQNAYLGRYRDTFAGFDLELVAGRFRRCGFAAAGFEGERRDWNLWGELAVFERLSGEPCFGGSSSRSAVSWIAGLEKDSGHDWRQGLAILHQDFGARGSGELAAAALTAPYRQGWLHLAASDYLLYNAKREMNPLTTLNINFLHSLVDGSNLIQPEIKINTGDESDFSVFAWLNTGQKPVAQGGAILPGSEFGSFSNGVGLIYRVFFKN